MGKSEEITQMKIKLRNLIESNRDKIVLEHSCDDKIYLGFIPEEFENLMSEFNVVTNNFFYDLGDQVEDYDGKKFQMVAYIAYYDIEFFEKEEKIIAEALNELIEEMDDGKFIINDR